MDSLVLKNSAGECVELPLSPDRCLRIVVHDEDGLFCRLPLLESNEWAKANRRALLSHLLAASTPDERATLCWQLLKEVDETQRGDEKRDGTQRLVDALHGRMDTAQDWLGGANARMLHEAADEIARLRAELAETRKARLEELLAAESAERVDTLEDGVHLCEVSDMTTIGVTEIEGTGFFVSRWEEGFDDPVDDCFLLEAELWPLALCCLSATLDAKRKREVEHG